MKNYIYIPPSRKTARKHLRSALVQQMGTMSKRSFLKSYCSLAYLYPGFHPDCIDDWNGPEKVLSIAEEAWRRAGEGELTDNELYPYQATKAGIVECRNQD